VGNLPLRQAIPVLFGVEGEKDRMKQKGVLTAKGKSKDMTGWFVWDDSDMNKPGIFITYCEGEPFRGKPTRKMMRFYQVYWRDSKGDNRWERSAMRIPVRGGQKTVGAIRTVSFPEIELIPEITDVLEQMYRNETGKDRPSDKEINDLIEEQGI
jgi:hypothetical protein